MAKFTKADYLTGDNFEDVPEKPYNAIIVSMTAFTGCYFELTKILHTYLQSFTLLNHLELCSSDVTELRVGSVSR